MAENSKSNAMTVSALTRQIKRHLEENLFSIWVGGEITGFSSPKSGHFYFSLKDDRTQISCAIWRSNAVGLNLEFLENGKEVICFGNVDVYGPRGIYQLNVRKIHPVGQGSLQRAFQQLFEKLKTEGIFDPAHKKSIPRFPRRVAVVTSPTSAAIRDFLQVIKRRWADIEIIVVPVQVQGHGSAEEIADAIYAIPDFADPPDVVVVTRGGGSMEDLWSFNEEAVCRAIFNCPIPVICGVGHEVDVTLSDLVADVRALTPSEAAEKLVPDKNEILESLSGARRRLSLALKSQLSLAERKLESLAMRPALRQPLSRIRDHERNLDELASRIQRASSSNLESAQTALGSLAIQLESLSPLSVLGRGYSLTTDLKNNVLTDSKAVEVGDTIKSRLSHGTITSRVEEIE